MKKQFGEGVDPEVSLDQPDAEAQSSASRELLRRLVEHGVKQSRYRLQGEVARGGMGAILKVWDEDLRRTLAMKVILGQGDSATAGETPPVDSRRLARFLEEAQVTGQLDHPGIVPVHELGLDSDGRVYFTMKLVKGRDFKQILDLVFEQKEGWSETRALGVILKACEAMAYAHTKGVIHRDLKPANVMVGNFGEVYVMDWGLARVLGRKDTHDIRLQDVPGVSLSSIKTERRDERDEAPDSPLVTMDGDVLGTPAYMPPEQAEGEIERLSPRSDVYAVGAMLYHLLARRMPYVPSRGRVSNRMVLRWVLEGPPKPVLEIRPDVPAELVAICEKAMARNAQDRYADTLALAEDLRAYMEHRVVAAYETGPVAELKKWIQRNRSLAAASAAALLLLVIGLATSANLYVRAEHNTDVARRNEELATQKSNDVLSLSAIQDLTDLVARADVLWPAQPENIPGYERWLEDARLLIDGEPADPARAVKAKPGLRDHERQLVELEARALPQMEEEATRERLTHPQAGELTSKQRKLAWMSRMLGRAAWPSESQMQPATEAELSLDAKQLNALAWPMTDPDKPAHGDETRALFLARKAVERAPESQVYLYRDTLAWALFNNGRLEDALAEERRATNEAPEAKKQEFEGYLTKLEAAIGRWTTKAERAQREEECSALTREVDELEKRVSKRRDWSFPDSEDRWWHVQLEQLVTGLASFCDEVTGVYSSATSPAHGWGMKRRLEFARTIEERSVASAEARARWAEAVASIRDRALSPDYDGLVLSPQIGLFPIGRDPASGLWEFAHLLTGSPAERGPDGRLTLAEDTGLVFVLVPAGSFWMGAQSSDPARRNYDPQPLDDESPPHEIRLSAYFLAKCEMTQGQWQRFVGSNPSQYGAHYWRKEWSESGRRGDLLHPVEQVSWQDCTRTLFRAGLALPTEAQWEYAARAGTSTPWWTGDAKESLAGAANIADSWGKTHGGSKAWIYEDWLDDGYSMHAPVGQYRANGFGLHDVTGNVWEWCRDGYAAYSLPVAPGDGERVVSGARWRVIRGGSLCNSPADARVANRTSSAPELRDGIVGLRPALSIATR